MKFVLNFSDVILSDTSFAAYEAPYTTPEEFRALRERLGDLFCVCRRDSSVFAVPLEASKPASNMTKVRLSVDDPRSVISAVMRQAIIRYIKRLGYRLINDQPPRFLNRNRDLLRELKGNADAILDNLYLAPTFVIAPRTLYKRNDTQVHGLQIDSRLTVSIDLKLSTLVSHGYEIVGKYAQTKRGYSDAWRADWDERSQRQRIGQVSAVHDGTVTVEGNDLDADDLWIESRFDNLYSILRWRNVSPQKLNDIDVKRHEYSKGDAKLKTLQGMVQRLSSADIKLCDGLTMRATPLYRPGNGYDAGEHHVASDPVFVFDLAREKTAKYPRAGLDKYGPFDVDSFPAKRARIVVVTPDRYQGDTERYLRYFRDGVPNGKAFQRGLLRKYHLIRCDFEVTAVKPPYDGLAYRNAALSALDDPNTTNLAIVVTEKETSALVGDANPYLVAKSVFMSQGVPVQDITIELVRSGLQNETSLAYTLDNIALASYAKMGGSPYVMAATSSLAQEVVIGIGNAVVKNAAGKPERVVGITTVFSADGNYLLSNASREVAYAEYQEELIATLKDVIAETKSRNAWQKGDLVRLIFHVFKPLKDMEAQAVMEIVSRLTKDYTVQYAFIHVSLDHDWYLFDTDSSATSSGKHGKGVYAPIRGQLIALGPRSAIATVTGPSEIKLARQGLPSPLLLNLHRASTFTDLEYLAGQAYRFTGLSWRSFLPSSLPVTVGYSEQIARLLGRLRGVKNWNPDSLKLRMKTSRWFL